MKRFSLFLLFLTLTTSAYAQIPPGANYDPAKHVNPVITYVLAKDFTTTTYKAALAASGIQLMGLSKEFGTLQGVDLAEPADDAAKTLKLRVNAKFYPVVRQTFKLTEEGEVVLYSFKAPKLQGLVAGRFSSGLPFPRRDPKDKRLGAALPPEPLEVRGQRGWIFDQDGVLTVLWEEGGVMYTATSSLKRQAFFNILDDLL